MLSFSLAVVAFAVAGADVSMPSAKAFDAPPDFSSLASTTLSYAPQAIDSGTPISSSIALGMIESTAQQTTATLPASDADASASAPAHDNRFFQRGSWRWYMQLGVGSDFGDEGLAIGGFGASVFLDDTFTMDFEFNGLYFSQSDGADTGGFNMALLFRWHFWRSNDNHWSIYADAGAGILFSGADVPPGGSSFNFTPQAGMGVSMLLNEERDVRLLSGVRWYHVSNANTFEDNPGLNMVMVYAGVNFPF